MTTTDLSDFGDREIAMLRDILTAMIEQGLPSDFLNDDVRPMMNQNSGNVFLTNSDYQVAMLNGEDLESFYTLPYSGIEGFIDDLYSNFKQEFITEADDLEYLADILDNNGEDEKAEEIRAYMENLNQLNLDELED